MTKSVTRLYNSFKPDSYQLQINPDPTSMSFTGSVTIRGKKASRPSQRLTFHQNGLRVTNAIVVNHTKKGDLEVPISRINHHKSLHEVRLHSDQTLYPGDYTVTMQFEGTIKRGLTGIYPAYFKHQGVEHMLLTTQFESHSAREAFPCIDEPEAKATFDLTLTGPKGHTFLSNTPIKTNKEADTKREVTFETTPRMSSYLLAFTIGELHSKSTKTKNGVEVSIWATIAQPAESFDFALEVAKHSIEFFEDYFGAPYPLPKADHIAIPDFSSGAMENWGLITYRERALLAYPGETSQSSKELIACVISHETSHQWFGNLVTMRWWDDLWLNESFANLMEYRAPETLFPEWNVWDHFVCEEGLAALYRDMIPGVQSVKVAVHHPDEINTLFDPSIVYAKGGRLLYMLMHYVGEEAFRKGLSEYFKTHAYMNTEGTDLWSALSKSSGKDIGTFMETWLNYPGFPVVTVKQDKTKLTLTQHHFSENKLKADANRIWPIPLFAGRSDVPEVLEGREQTVILDNDAFVRIDQDARGHYIVDYETPEQHQALINLVKEGKMPIVDRLMTLTNSDLLARAGYESFGETLRLLEAYKDEASEPVWDAISIALGDARKFIDYDPSLEDKIKAFVRPLIRAQYERLGWEVKDNEPASDQKLRATIIGLGSYADEPEIVEHAKQLFSDHVANGTTLPPELRHIIYGAAVKHDIPGAIDTLLKLHDETPNSEMKIDIALGLTATRKTDVAERLLGRLQNPELVKPQDADRWMAYLMRNRHTKKIAWQWMEDNWGWIEKTYSSDKSYDYMPRYAASCCNTAEWRERFITFFKPKEDQIMLKRNILMGVEEITNRVAWLERDLEAVQKFFK